MFRICVASVLLLVVGAAAVRPTYLINNPGEVLLNVDPSFMWEWTLTDRTYSTEAALQSAGLFLGQYASMETYRFAGNSGNSSAADHELVLDSTAITAAEAMGLSATQFSGASNGNTAFATWLKAEIGAGRPVLLGVYKRINETVGGYGDYDHVALVVGYTANATHPNLATLAILDFFADTVRHLPSDALFKRRDEWRSAELNPGRPYDFAVPADSWKALSIRIRDTNVDAPSQAGVVQVNVSMFREPRWPVGETVQNVTLDVTVSGLIADRFYRLLRFDSNLSIPSSNYLASSNIGWSLEFRADSSGARHFPAVHYIDSDATAAFRIVIVNAPAATPAPPIVVARDATCLTDGPGVYSMDASAVECKPLRRCRKQLCGCLGVGDGNRCWLRSLLPCSRYSMCFALATHCIESVAIASGEEDTCRSLNRTYTASLPPATPAHSNNDRVYRESSLGRQCYSFACEAFRSYFPSNERCTLDYNQVCDLPQDKHFRLELKVASADVSRVVEYHVNRENFAAAAKGDMDAALSSINGGANSATVLSVSGEDAKLYIDARIEQTTEFPNIDSFVTSMSEGVSSWTRTVAALRVAGESGTVTVVAFKTRGVPPEEQGLGGLLDDCDNTCVIAVSVGAIVVIAAVMCIVFCIRYLCCEQPDDAGASSMSAAVRKVMDKQKQREIARKNGLEDGEELTRTNEPTEL